MKSLVLVFLLAALGWAGPTLAGIPSTQTQAATPTDRETWVQAIRDARDDLATARWRYEEARKSYSKMKQRRKARGARKEALVQDRTRPGAAPPVRPPGGRAAGLDPPGDGAGIRSRRSGGALSPLRPTPKARVRVRGGTRP